MKKILLLPFFLAFVLLKFTIKIFRTFFLLLKSLRPTEFKNNYSLYQIDSMDGHSFEHFSKELLFKDGFYNLVVTRGSGDQGIDIIGNKDGMRIGIQCKKYSAKVSNKAIQEAFAGKAFYNLDEVYVLTNNYFTDSAIELAYATNVILLDRDYLSDLMSKSSLIQEQLLPTSIEADVPNTWGNNEFEALSLQDQRFFSWIELDEYRGQSPVSHLQIKFRISYTLASNLRDFYLDNSLDDVLDLLDD